MAKGLWSIFSWVTFNIDDDYGDDDGDDDDDGGDDFDGDGGDDGGGDDGDNDLQLGHLLVLICGHCYELALLDNVTINN